MFNFGNPKDTAKMLVAEVARDGGGPGIVDKDESLYTWQETRDHLIYASAALRQAANRGEEDEVLYALSLEYERLLVHYCEFRDHIYNAMKTGDHQYPWADPGAVARQKHMVYKIVEARKAKKDPRKS